MHKDLPYLINLEIYSDVPNFLYNYERGYFAMIYTGIHIVNGNNKFFIGDNVTLTLNNGTEIRGCIIEIAPKFIRVGSITSLFEDIRDIKLNIYKI